MMKKLNIEWFLKSLVQLNKTFLFYMGLAHHKLYYQLMDKDGKDAYRV